MDEKRLRHFAFDWCFGCNLLSAHSQESSHFHHSMDVIFAFCASAHLHLHSRCVWWECAGCVCAFECDLPNDQCKIIHNNDLLLRNRLFKNRINEFQVHRSLCTHTHIKKHCITQHVTAQHSTFDIKYCTNYMKPQLGMREYVCE